MWLFYSAVLALSLSAGASALTCLSCGWEDKVCDHNDTRNHVPCLTECYVMRLKNPETKESLVAHGCNDEMDKTLDHLKYNDINSNFKKLAPPHLEKLVNKARTATRPLVFEGIKYQMRVRFCRLVPKQRDTEGRPVKHCEPIAFCSPPYCSEEEAAVMASTPRPLAASSSAAPVSPSPNVESSTPRAALNMTLNATSAPCVVPSLDQMIRSINVSNTNVTRVEGFNATQSDELVESVKTMLRSMLANENATMFTSMSPIRVALRELFKERFGTGLWNTRVIDTSGVRVGVSTVIVVGSYSITFDVDGKLRLMVSRPDGALPPAALGAQDNFEPKAAVFEGTFFSDPERKAFVIATVRNVVGSVEKAVERAMGIGDAMEKEFGGTNWQVVYADSASFNHWYLTIKEGIIVTIGPHLVIVFK